MFPATVWAWATSAGPSVRGKASSSAFDRHLPMQFIKVLVAGGLKLSRAGGGAPRWRGFAAGDHPPPARVLSGLLFLARSWSRSWWRTRSSVGRRPPRSRALRYTRPSNGRSRRGGVPVGPRRPAPSGGPRPRPDRPSPAPARLDVRRPHDPARLPEGPGLGDAQLPLLPHPRAPSH